MSFPNRIVSAYINHRAVLTLLAVMLLLEILFVLRLFVPSSMRFLVDFHIFEIVVLLAIGQVILLLARLLYRGPRRICEDEHQCQVALREVLASDRRARSLHVFSAGLGSRLDFLTTVHRATDRFFTTQVIAQAPANSPDRQDASRLRSNLEILQRDHATAPLEIRLSTVPASLRAMIVCDSKGQPFWAAASWYIYQPLNGSGVRVAGRSNPSLILDGSSSSEDKEMLLFLHTQFRRIWSSLERQVAFSGGSGS